MASSPAAASSSVDASKDSWVPTFSNRPQDYKEWRARIHLYQKKMVLQKKPQEGVINLLTTLSGTAWKQVEPIAESASEDKEGGFTKVIEILDKTFRYDARVEQPRSFEKFFYSLTRRYDQTLMSYCAEHREALREVEKHGIKLPTEITGWLMLRRSGLSQDQKHLVQSQCGSSLEESKVEEAMYYLYGQDYRGKVGLSQRPVGGKGKGFNKWKKPAQAYTMHEDDYMDDPEETYEPEYDEAYYEETQEEYADEAYDEEFGDETANYTGYDEDYPDQEDPEYEEAYATYLDARRRFAELRNNRGFYPVVALTDGATSSSPTSSQRPYPPRSKGGKGKGKGQGSKSPPQKGDAKSRGRTALNQAKTCLRCGPGHFAAQCTQKRSTTNSPTNSAKKAKAENAMMVQFEMKDYQRIPKGIFGTMDGGASCMVLGHDILMNYIESYHEQGFDVSSFHFRPAQKTLQFGGDNSLEAQWTVHMPVCIQGSPDRQANSQGHETPAQLHGRHHAS